MRGIFAEGDKACEGGYKRTYAANVYSDQKLSPIFGKFRKQNSRGYVTDDLAREHACQKSVLFKQKREETADRVYSRNVSCQKEEANEGKEQGVVHLCKGASVGEKHREKNNGQADIVWNYSENGQNGKSEQNEIKRCFGGDDPFASFVVQAKRFLGNKEAASGEKRN